MLTNQQKEGYEKIRNWLNSDDSFFLLEGFAGTGKSYLIDEIIKSLKGHKVCYAAPTHKAVAVSKTNVDKLTLHKLLGLSLNTDKHDFDPLNPHFDKQKSAMIHKYKYVIIDECSMISESMFKSIVKFATDLFSVKIIFVGDPKQLPPINETLSPCFDVVPKFTLTETVRTNNAILIDVCTDLRNGRLGNLSNLESLSKSDFIKKLRDGQEFDKILCYTNDNVVEWNNLVKSIKNPSPYVFCKGDRVVFTKNGANYLNSEEGIIGDMDIKEDKGALMEYMRLRIRTERDNVVYVKVVLPQSHNSWIDKHNTILTQCKKTRKWDMYYAFTEEWLLAERLYNTNKALIFDRSLDLSHASTIHKAQGSTYKRIAVDFEDICKSPIKADLLYTAYSRASREAITIS
jgi:ATP-dependent exoDNAse (exonuclease V) alpha subunit